MTVHALKVVAVALALCLSGVGATSTGTGSCAAGEAAVQGGIHVTSTKGPLADAGVTFSVGGAAIAAGGTTNVAVGTDLQWSVDAAQLPIKGLFVRVEKLSDDFTHTGDASLKESPLCATFGGVIGLDHVNGQLTKTSVTGTTNFASAGNAIIDVIVVFSATQWAYSTYSLNIEESSVPVDAPVAVPVDAPVAVPVDTPVAAPVDAPVAVPVDTPVAAPVADVPTPVTVSAPVAEVPTADGECPEGKGKGKGEGKGKGDDDSSGKGMGMGKMDKKKCKKTPKEPKTPKVGKGGKGKGDDTSARRLK